MGALFLIASDRKKKIIVDNDGRTIVEFTITKRLKLLKLYRTNTMNVEELQDAVKIAQLFLAYIKSENLV